MSPQIDLVTRCFKKLQEIKKNNKHIWNNDMIDSICLTQINNEGIYLVVTKIIAFTKGQANKPGMARVAAAARVAQNNHWMEFILMF